MIPVWLGFEDEEDTRSWLVEDELGICERGGDGEGEGISIGEVREVEFRGEGWWRITRCSLKGERDGRVKGNEGWVAST